MSNGIGMSTGIHTIGREWVVSVRHRSVAYNGRPVTSTSSMPVAAGRPARLARMAGTGCVRTADQVAGRPVTPWPFSRNGPLCVLRTMTVPRRRSAEGEGHPPWHRPAGVRWCRSCRWWRRRFRHSRHGRNGSGDGAAGRLARTMPRAWHGTHLARPRDQR